MIKIHCGKIFLLLLFVGIAHGQTDRMQNPLTLKNYDLALDALFMAGVFVFDRVQVNANHPVFESEQKDYIDESIPTWAAGALTAPFGGLPILLEGEDGFYHARGFFLSYCANAFAHSLSGSLFGRHRPNYDAALALGEEAEKTSFYSGHASISFGTATYASAYLLHTKRTWAIPAALALYGGAGYVAYTRYAENYHHISDLIAGALAGTGISYGVFRYFIKDRGEALVHLRAAEICPGVLGARITMKLR